MPIRPRAAIAAIAAMAALALTLTPSAATAQARPGVGYDPHARGLTVSRYELDTLGSPFLSYAIDFSARPDLVGASPNPYALVLSDPAVHAAYEQRWGPYTATTRLKRWAGPGNEVRFVLRDALAWAWANQPGLLGGDTTNRNGQPTEVEITDMQATGDRDVYVAYFRAAVQGFSPDNRVVICDPAQPSGDFQTYNSFWSLPYYYHNNFRPSYYSPQSPGSGCPGG